jgi:fatty acid desaturase
VTSHGQSPARRVRKVDEYAELKRLAAEEGLLDRGPRMHSSSAIGLVLLLSATLLAIAATRGSWWVLASALPAALLFGQIGFLAHDAAHNQIFKTSRANYVLGLVLFNLCLGGSRGWWADKHSAHHAQPNRLGTDPDIDGGVVDVSGLQAPNARGLARFIIRHQAAAIVPILSLSVLQIHAYSGGFLRDSRLRNRRAELGLLIAHYTIYLGCLTLALGPGRGLAFAAAHQLLLGIYLGGAFLPNHVGMPVLEPDQQVDFLRRQVSTARNIRGTFLTDYLFGGLSCQIEHHLFPAMPRPRLRAAQPIVRRYCAEHGIAYLETSAWEAYRQVFHHLSAIGRATRNPPARHPGAGRSFGGHAREMEMPP